MEANSDIHVQAAEQDTTPRVKPKPKKSFIPVPFIYHASDDGTDENLLILLHGIGDTETRFGQLGKQLRLPQTAVLALRAPLQIPFLDEGHYQWYPSFDQLGDLLQNPNPTIALDLMTRCLDHLITACGWAPEKIHFFGFGQGGSVALESCLGWWKKQLAGKTSDESQSPVAFGSVVTVMGPLLSHPTLSSICPTPCLAFNRNDDPTAGISKDDLASLKKGFKEVKEVRFPGQSMPRIEAEWRPIMKFWSERLSRRNVEGLYQIMSGSV